MIPANGLSPADPQRPLDATGTHRYGRSTPTVADHHSSHLEAICLYERGLEALQSHDYLLAHEHFTALLTRFPDETDLHDRARLYLNVCRRHLASADYTPQTVAERLFAATLAINAGDYELALTHLHLVRDEEPDNDHASYMLAITHAQRGECTEALHYLDRAVALNPDNRFLARNSADLEPVKDHEEFRRTVGLLPPPEQETEAVDPTDTTPEL